MSSSIHYWAIPPESALYKCLQEDAGYNTVMFYLLPYSADLYDFRALGPTEAEEIIEDTLERSQPLLGENPSLKIDAFFAEISKIRVNHPGIEHRRAMLEQCDTAIRCSLIQALEQEYEDATELVKEIMHGDGVLHPDLRQPGRRKQPWEDTIGLISAPLVRRGADILKAIPPSILFPSNQDMDRWYRENYQRWQKAYIAAAENKECLLVRVF